MSATNYVLRSVYLEPEVDNFLREQAFNLAVSKNDLIRRYVLAAAKAELEAALGAAPSSALSRSVSTGVLRAARVAKIISRGSSDPDARSGSPLIYSHRSGRHQASTAAKKAAKKVVKKAAKKAAKKVVKKAAKKRAAKA